ncbi:MAG: hypothetical protein LBT09_04295 [Planctomycetaceae bacterium]|jgi:hypothetical protein|nr:hypothetical protein [Planctomycetaceae bacterium]
MILLKIYWRSEQPFVGGQSARRAVAPVDRSSNDAPFGASSEQPDRRQIIKNSFDYRMINKMILLEI